MAADWGFSYGTIIGQYMVKILPSERLGRLIIDGVVNAAQWKHHSDHFFDREPSTALDRNNARLTHVVVP